LDINSGWFFLRKKLFLFVIILFLSFSLFACSDKDYTPSFSDKEIEEAFSFIRGALEGNSPAAPKIDAKGFILAIYDGKGNRKVAAASEFQPAVTVLTQLINSIDYDTSYLTLSIITDISRVRIEKLAQISPFYTEGVNGVAHADDGHITILDPPFIAARDYDFSEITEKLSKGDGVNISGLKLSNGLYSLDCESFTEPAPGKSPLPLFRANTLIKEASPEIINDSIRLAGDMLIRLQRADGRFHYEYFPGKDKFNRKGYNLLRHAGTCYSLFGLYGATNEEKYLLAGRRGIEWLENRMKTPNWDKKRAYPVYHRKAKLGGAGLSLLALVERVKVDPEYDVTPLMKKLAYHLRMEQKENGSFNSYYSWDKKPVKKRFSIYYPGEAMLALIRYDSVVKGGSPESLNVAEKGAAFLIDKRWRIVGLEVNVPPDAWLMMALYDLWKVRPNDKYVDYCLRIAKNMTGDQIISILPSPDFYGGYFPFPPQVTPAGARLEGLTAAYYLAKETGRPTDYIFDVIRRGSLFQIRMMVRPEFAHLFKNPQMALGTFRHSPLDSKNRIDYNQHNISGLIEAANILEAGR